MIKNQEDPPAAADAEDVQIRRCVTAIRTQVIRSQFKHKSVQTHSVQKQCVRITIETITGAADSSARSVPTPDSRSALIYESVSGAFRVEQLPYNSLKVKIIPI